MEQSQEDWLLDSTLMGIIQRNGAAAEVADYLQQIIDLLREPGSWIQSCYARNQEGEAVKGSSPYACQWCLSGACEYVTRKISQKRMPLLRRFLAQVLTRPKEGETLIHATNIWLINDQVLHTHKEMWEWVTKARASYVATMQKLGHLPPDTA